MALSNIFKEPRREITETAVGAIVVAAAVGADYYLGKWISAESCHDDRCLWVIDGMFFGALMMIGVVVIFIVLPIIVHGIGESLCDVLENRLGICLRPRQRR